MLYLYQPNKSTFKNLQINQPLQIIFNIRTCKDKYFEMIVNSIKQNCEINLEFKGNISCNQYNQGFYQQDQGCYQQDKVSDEAFRYLGELKNVDSLTIKFVYMTFPNITKNAFTFLGNAFQNLKSLNLAITYEINDSQQVYNEGLIEIFKSLPQSLISLNLNISQKSFKTEILILMGQQLEKLINLKELTLIMKNSELQSEGWIYFIQQLTNLKMFYFYLDISNLGNYGRELNNDNLIIDNLILFLRNNENLINVSIILCQSSNNRVDLQNEIVKINRRVKNIYQMKILNQLNINKQIDIIKYLL